jgi:hypothetical protein
LCQSVAETRSGSSRGKRKSKYNVFATSVFVLGVYTSVDISSDLGSFPMVSALPGIVLLAPIYRRQFLARAYWFSALFVLLPAVFGAFAPSFPGSEIRRLIACGQLFYSLTVGFLLFWIITESSRDRIFRFLSIAVPIYLALISLEVLTPLKDLVTAYSLVYRDVDVAQMVFERDLGIAGGYRPKFFTLETSYVAMTLAFAIGCYVWSGRTFKKYLFASLYTLAGLIAIRSPILLSGVLFMAIRLSVEVVRYKSVRQAAGSFLPFALFGGLLTIPLVYIAMEPVIEGRLTSVNEGADTSVIYRTYGALAAGVAVANAYPIAGVGIGSYDYAQPIIIEAYSNLGFSADDVIREWRSVVANAYGYILILFGYIGSAVIFSAVFYLLRLLAGPLSLSFFAMVLVLAQAYTPVYSPKFVAYVFIFAGLNSVLRK